MRNPQSSEYEYMKTLTNHIAARIGERAFCVVFEDELERCWPGNKIAEARRRGDIQNFAESHGWTAAILEGAFGTRAIFEGLAYRGLFFAIVRASPLVEE